MELITVVISTRKTDEEHIRKVKKAFSHPKTEFLIVENEGKMSLPEVYNKGLADASNNLIVFMHDDLVINSTNMSNKINKLFEKFPDYGIIGVAGTTDLVSGTWWEIKKSMEGKMGHTQDGKTWTNKYSDKSYVDTLKDVVTVDGVFFIVDKRKIKHTFDTDFKGFHFYDIPFCINNYLDGVKIGVTTKFDLLHKSVGQTNDQWGENKKQFEEKFKDVLPIKMTSNKSPEERMNYTKDTIGVGMVTYKAEDRIRQSAATIPGWVKHFVIVNDGTPYDEGAYPEHAHVIQHEVNKCVGQAKNSAIDYLMEAGCDHIFIIEDDILIKDEAVFDKYIKTSLNTGVKHLNYALQGPANKKGSKGFENLDDRAKQDHLTEPNPRQITKYPSGYEIAMYPNSVGAFSYYQREVLEKIGGFDKVYKNAWEHVDHTMEAFKNGFTSPYWWFADINESWKYIDNIEGCIENSTIGHTDEWNANYKRGYLHFKKKFGFGPTEVPDTKPENLQSVMNYLFQNK